MSFDTRTSDASDYEREFRRMVKPLMVEADTANDASRRFREDAERVSIAQEDASSFFTWVTVKSGRVQRVPIVGFDAHGNAALQSRDPATEPVRAGAEEPRPHRIGYSLYYRACWMLLGVAALVWGVVVGASAAGAMWVGLSTAVSGVVAILGLMITLFVAGRVSSNAT